MKSVWVLYIEGQEDEEDGQPSIAVFETEQLMESWLKDFIKDNKLNEKELVCHKMLNRIFVKESWR